MKDRNGWPVEPGELVRLAGDGLHERLRGSVARVVAEWEPRHQDERHALAHLGHHGPFVQLRQGARLLILPESHIEHTAPRRMEPSGLTLDEIIEELNQ